MYLSIIIPCYNAQNTINRAIDSIYSTKLLNQKVDIILSDDASDQPYDYLLEQYPELRIYRFEDNRGAGVARQRVIPFAKGEYITFLDADDTIHLNILKNLDRMVDKPDVILSAVEHIDSDLNILKRVYDTEITWICHGKFFRREFLLENDIHFDPYLRYYEDTYFTTLAYDYAVRKNTTLKIKAIGHTFYHHAGSTTTSIPNYFDVTEPERIHSACLLLERHMGVLYTKEYYISQMKYTISSLLSGKYSCYSRIFESVKRVLSIETYDEFIACFEPTKDLKEYYDTWKKSFSNIKLSIIIPLHNSHKYIKNTLANLYRLLGENIINTEVILEDDNSDNPDYLYLSNYPNIQIHHNDILGRMGINRDRGLRAAKGKWVTFLDHDDELTGDMIQDFFSKDYEDFINIIRGKTLNIEDNIQNPYTSAELLHGVLYRRSFLVENNIYFHQDLRTSEDSYFNRRAYLISKYSYGENSILEIDKVYYWWNLHDDSTLFKEYNGHSFCEEFYREYIKACLLAYDDDSIPEDVKKSSLIRCIIDAEFKITLWKRESKNFRKANYKVLCALLLLLEEKYNIRKYNFLSFISDNIKMVNEFCKNWEDDLSSCIYRDFPETFFCYSIIDKISNEKKEEIKQLLY